MDYPAHVALQCKNKFIHILLTTCVKRTSRNTAAVQVNDTKTIMTKDFTQLQLGRIGHRYSIDVLYIIQNRFRCFF